MHGLLDFCITVRAVDHHWRNVINATPLLAGNPVRATQNTTNKSSEHSHSTSLQRKLSLRSLHTVQLNAVRSRCNRTATLPRRTTCHGPCRLQVILMAGLVNIVKPWMIHCCAILLHVGAHRLLLIILALWT